MVFGSRGTSSKLLIFKLSLLGKDINPAQSVKDLGVIVDPTLSFDNHISTTELTIQCRRACRNYLK